MPKTVSVRILISSAVRRSDGGSASGRNPNSEKIAIARASDDGSLSSSELVESLLDESPRLNQPSPPLADAPSFCASSTGGSGEEAVVEAVVEAVLGAVAEMDIDAEVSLRS